MTTLSRRIQTFIELSKERDERIKARDEWQANNLGERMARARRVACREHGISSEEFYKRVREVSL